MECSKPLVSVIVPIYNVEEYLAQCLESLIKQTYTNLQILCVNDGSTDNSKVILSKYADLDQRIMCLDKPNGGLSSARNYAHAYVNGQYIMYLDSDDWIEPDTCEYAVSAAMESQTDVVIWNYTREMGGVSSPKMIFDENKRVFTSENEIRNLHRRFVGLYQDELAHPEKANALDTAWGKLYRAEIILRNGIEFVDTKIIGTEDALFNLYVFGYVKRAVYLPENLNHYRRNNESSLTKTYKRKLREQWQCLHGIMRDYIAQNGLDESFETSLNNRIALSIIGLGINVLRGGKEVKRLHEIRRIIRDEEYRKATVGIELKYFPIHWKLFFWGTKNGQVFLTYFLLRCIVRMKGN